MWVSDLVGVASRELLCDIVNPQSTEPVCQLFELLPKIFKHNTVPAVLVLRTACMAFHYGIVIATKKSCGVPLAFGPSGTGKTMSLRCGLSLFGAHNQHMFQQGTLQFFSNRCTVPFGIDDPSHSNDLAELLLSVFNGTKRANIARGSNKSQSSPIIYANFSLQDKAARCVVCVDRPKVHAI